MPARLTSAPPSAVAGITSHPHPPAAGLGRVGAVEEGEGAEEGEGHFAAAVRNLMTSLLPASVAR